MKLNEFRAWDGLNKKFSYWTMNDLCSWDTKTEKPSALYDWNQYTGIKDIEGKQIYEGDFLEYEFDFGSGPQSTILEVEDYVYGKDIMVSGGGFPAEEINKGFKIIGNIYETN